MLDVCLLRYSFLTLNWTDYLRRTQAKKIGGIRRSLTRVLCFASWNTQAFNFYRSLDCARKKTSLFYTFQRSIKLIEIYVYARKKHPSSGYPAAKHPKHSKFAITDIREKPVNLFYCSTRASTFANSGSCAKVSVPVHIYNSLSCWLLLLTASERGAQLSLLGSKILYISISLYVRFFSINVTNVWWRRKKPPAYFGNDAKKLLYF